MHIVPAEDIDARLVSEILSGPNYFTCERTHTRMKKEICVKRQTRGIRAFGGSWKYAREIPSECVNCEQGKEIKSAWRMAHSAEGIAKMEDKVNKPFWCFGWHQQIFPYLCLHRYKKGMKKCEGCDIGKKLMAREFDALREGAAEQVDSKE